MVLRTLLLTFAGLAVLFAGLYITFGYIKDIVDGGNIWLLVLSIPLTALGSFLLFRAGKSNATIMKKNLYEPTVFDGKPIEAKKGLENTLEKNAAMTDQFAKTNEARNRLKLLQASAEAQK